MASCVSATTVFLTSDSIGGNDNDITMLESIKSNIEELSGGQLTVVIDSNAPGPGEGTRAIESGADVSVNLANVCAGNLLILAKYAVNSDNQIIYVNTGDFDLDDGENYIRRAWDDDYSSGIFAGINNPGQFLRDAGIEYIQPMKEYPDKSHSGSYTQSNDEVNRYIAQQIINKINQNKKDKSYDNGLVVTHSIDTSKMAQASNELMAAEDTQYNDTYNSYTAPQLLYLTSMYLNGNGLQEPDNYEQPDNPWSSSLFAKDSYKISDYMKMGGIVKNYMDENNKAPDYIQYEGAYIAYPDLVHNFAKVTENHTDSSHMNFDNAYKFEKVNHSLLFDILPFAIIFFVLIIVYAIIRKIIRSRFRRRRY